MVISTSREGTLTVICAHDQREARDVQRSMGLTGRETVVISSEHDVLRLYGVGRQVRVVETRRFYDRRDAARIREALTRAVASAELVGWPQPGRALVDQEGGHGLVGAYDIAAAAAPKGTRPDWCHHMIIPEHVTSPGLITDAKQDLARAVGQPHLLLTLADEHLPPGDPYRPPKDHYRPGWRVLFAVTLRADNPGYAVLRPGASLPDGWLPDDFDGRWMVRPTASRTIQMARAGTDLRFPPDWLYATPTGRIEVRDDSAIAEVWEVTA
ncbi:hypothetical protein [Nonomuraea sp. NPDC005650]|uniref:hypothetical protein n=1 Tax=Nonomuraea sp. NPDC005650 TaxID=3157045 RepID=UPI0033AF486C